MSGPDRLRGVFTDDGRPGADPPGLDQSVLHVGIRGDEPFDDVLRVCPKEEDGAVDRVCKCASEEQLASLGGLPGETEMRQSGLAVMI